MRALGRSAFSLAALLAVAGCSTATNMAKEPLPVTVSSANYSQLSAEELYARVNLDPINVHPEAPAAAKPAAPVFYLLLPGEVYPSDVTLVDVYRELEAALEPRGYYNAIFQKRAPNTPARVDYVLRVHFGERPWLLPTVRTDGVTWGNDGLEANRFRLNLFASRDRDPREGLSWEEEMAMNRLIDTSSGGGSFGMGSGWLRTTALRGWYWDSFGSNGQLWRDFGNDSQEARDYYLFVVEAFKLDDIRVMNRKAPCIWSTFVAVPADRGLKYSSVLKAMLRTAGPYFAETTHGVQAYEVPPGKVLVGAPVVLPAPGGTPQ